MSMSRKDYEKMAAILAGEFALARSIANDDVRFAKVEVVRNVTFSVADMFAQDNQRFDRQRFYTAATLSLDYTP